MAKETKWGQAPTQYFRSELLVATLLFVQLIWSGQFISDLDIALIKCSKNVDILGPTQFKNGSEASVHLYVCVYVALHHMKC